MGYGVKYLILFSWMSFLCCAGLILFSRGFLLRRNVIITKTACTGEIDRNFNLLMDADLKITTSPCWLPSRFKRAVVIIIDGLRYDFIHFNASLKDSEKSFYHNKFPFIRDLLERKSQHSALLKFIADPPTTTLQRIKGLVTGSLPTFIDAGDNFASPEINEDNLIDQLVAFNKNVTFMGDDTWLALLPRRFTKTIPFPSFNVKDLHTVDDGVSKHLVPEIKSKGWDVIIAHFLGVDHCGHRYGPAHLEMSNKLDQMNDILRSVVESLEPDTVLFVLGDHGMTDSGDHGGDSFKEISSALFIFSPSKLWDTLKPPPLEAKQIDFVPTFSILLGIPIPFGNLGTVINEFVILEDGLGTGNSKKDDVKNLYFGAHALYRNAKQVDKYLSDYGAVSDDLLSNGDEISKLQKKMKDINTLWELITSDAMQASNLTPSLCTAGNLTREFLQQARDVCLAVWAQFDISSMLLGLVMVTLTLTLIVLQITLSLQTNCSIVYIIGFFTLIGTSILINLYYPFITGVKGFESKILVIIVVVSFLLYIAGTFRNRIREKCIEAKYAVNCEPVPVLILVLMFAFHFSNSYVVCEDSVLSFFVISLLWFKTLFSNPDRKQEKRLHQQKQKYQPLPWHRLHSIVFAVVSAVCIRAFTIFRKCREEQWWCESTAFLRPLSDITTSNSDYSSLKSWRFFISVGCVWVSVSFFQWLLRRAGNLNGYLPAVMCATYSPVVMGVLICFYWALHCLPPTLFGHVLQHYELVLPNVVFAIALFSIMVLFLKPLCIYTLNPNNDNIGPIFSADKGETLHLVYKYMKANWRKHSQDNSIIVYGLASVFSGSIFAVISIVIPSLMLLTSDGFALAFLMLIATAASVLQCLVKLKPSTKQYDEVMYVPWSWVMLWSLISLVGFYATGHQQTFPSIHWNAAMVGSDGHFTIHFLPAVKVVLNTFSSTLLFGLSLPLLLLWPVTSRLIFDSGARYVSDTTDGIKKGEFFFHGKSDFFKALYYLCGKYLAIHGMKLLGSMLAATVLRRHLMVWKIFAPRFVFEAFNFLVMTFAVVLAFVLIVSVHYALDRWVRKFTKHVNVS